MSFSFQLDQRLLAFAKKREKHPSYNLKTNRTFTLIRKYGFLYTLSVAIGGLIFPKWGLSVIAVMLGLILVSFYKGRYWCGNVCGHGSLYDTIFMPFSRNAAVPKFLKSKWMMGGFFIWFMYQFSGRFIDVFQNYEANTSVFWDQVGLVFVMTYISVTTISTILGLSIAPRAWCNFCPMGTMQKGSYKLGKAIKVTELTDEKISIVNKDMCHKCGKCARVCPMQLKPYTEFNDNNQLENPNCIRCSTCVENCPAGILTLSTKKTAQKLTELTPDTGHQSRQRIEAKIIKIKHLKPDVRELTFEFVTPKEVAYRAGEFILVRIKQEPEEMFRAYSISSYNRDNRTVSVTVKQAPNGYGTDIIFNTFKEGDSAVLEGPLGHELVVDPQAEKVLLIGGGIGITPMLPIATELTESRGNQQQVTLLYGVNREDELLYRDEFEQLTAQADNFDFVPMAAFDEQWQGEKGFVTNYMTKIKDLPAHKVYMCGPPPMVKAAKSTLLELGVPESNIFYESA